MLQCTHCSTLLLLLLLTMSVDIVWFKMLLSPASCMNALKTCDADRPCHACQQTPAH